MRREVLVLGGGLAGIAAATALAKEGCSVTLVERRRTLGGRASAFPAEDGWLDNCQHVILGCCVNLLQLLEDLGTRHRVEFHPKIPFLANGKTTLLSASPLPPPAHFLPWLLRARFFSPVEKWRVLQLFLKLLFGAPDQESLDQITMLEWLAGAHQPPRLIEHFWNLILVSSLNETLERMSAKYGVMVLREAFLPHRDAALLGTPNVSLTELYSQAARGLFERWSVRAIRGTVREIRLGAERPEAFLEDGTTLAADDLVCALPFYNLLPVLPNQVREDPFFARFRRLETSPILGIHLWFAERATDSPFGALPGSPIHWFFTKPGASDPGYVQLVVSACHDLIRWKTEDLIRLGVEELGKFLPAVRRTSLLRWQVVRETRATFSPKPGCDRFRPPQQTPVPRLYLAGDWTQTGWPATMEGAVRSGYLAAGTILNKKLVREALPASGLSALFLERGSDRKKRKGT